MPSPATSPPPETSLVETLQSLIVAFVVAMTFRGFVVEGFVIPTGSMAPTLMGAHARIQSRQTGWDFPVGVDQLPPDAAGLVSDPMLGPRSSGGGIAGPALHRRMGDRILVVKSLYPFFEPKRFDVVVFKNPTRSQGDEANYIKRLIGLPNEELWLCDGDVFVRRHGEQTFAIQRKPEHVQRAVWQCVHDSDFVPVNVQKLNEQSTRGYEGPPWVGDAGEWDLAGREYRCLTADNTELRWDSRRREIDDWTSYNMLVPPQYQARLTPVSDIRVRATLVAQSAGLISTLELRTRSHIFEFSVAARRAVMRVRPAADQGETVLEREAEIELPEPGQPFTLECWHADQAMRLFINGREVMAPLHYDWAPVQRLQNAAGAFDVTDADALLNRSAAPPQLRWTFTGSPFVMHRVRVDRDLHYRRDILRGNAIANPTNPGYEHHVRPGMPGFGTHPNNMAQLHHDQFMMAGDNSQMSLDSRLWGNPDALVASQIDPAPFVVNRKLLLGKAWVVYFPSPFAVKDGGWPVIPDFGRLRFIR